MNILERMIFEPRGGIYREFEGLTTHLEPQNYGFGIRVRQISQTNYDHYQAKDDLLKSGFERALDVQEKSRSYAPRFHAIIGS